MEISIDNIDLSYVIHSCLDLPLMFVLVLIKCCDWTESPRVELTCVDMVINLSLRSQVFLLSSHLYCSFGKCTCINYVGIHFECRILAQLWRTKISNVCMTFRSISIMTFQSSWWWIVLPKNYTMYIVLEQVIYYRPQTNFARVMFLHLSVSHSVHGGGSPGPHPRRRLWGLARGVSPCPHSGGGWGSLAWVCPGPHLGGVQAHTGGMSRPTPGGCVQAQAGGEGWIPACTEADSPPPPQTATVAGGTHPTGMHSCFV